MLGLLLFELRLLLVELLFFGLQLFFLVHQVFDVAEVLLHLPVDFLGYDFFIELQPHHLELVVILRHGFLQFFFVRVELLALQLDRIDQPLQVLVVVAQDFQDLHGEGDLLLQLALFAVELVLADFHQLALLRYFAALRIKALFRCLDQSLLVLQRLLLVQLLVYHGIVLLPLVDQFLLLRVVGGLLQQHFVLQRGHLDVALLELLDALLVLDLLLPQLQILLPQLVHLELQPLVLANDLLRALRLGARLWLGGLQAVGRALQLARGILVLDLQDLLQNRVHGLLLIHQLLLLHGEAAVLVQGGLLVAREAAVARAAARVAAGCVVAGRTGVLLLLFQDLADFIGGPGVVVAE